MMIPLLINKKFLQIKLRDYPHTEGLPIEEFLYKNTVKPDKIKKTQENNATGQTNPNNQSALGLAKDQNKTGMPAKETTSKSSKAASKRKPARKRKP